MTDKTRNPETDDCNTAQIEEDEIDLLELARVIWKGRKLIIAIVVSFTLCTAVGSLFMTNIYTAKAVLKPVSSRNSVSRFSSLASQFSGLASLAGIAMPGAASSTEIVSLLKSNILKKKVIEQHNLMPVLFPQQWNEEKKQWNKKGGFSLNPLVLIGKLAPARPGNQRRESGVPDVRDGIRRLDGIVRINYDMKDDIITISADFKDPDMAAQIVNYFIVSLNDHMSEEARRIASLNKAYLEKQLQETQDSLVRQKIYALIAEKIETMMMAEVNADFAFKVLDPPIPPDRKSKPRRAMMVVVAVILSAFLAVFVVLCKEYLPKIKTRSAGGQNAL